MSVEHRGVPWPPPPGSPGLRGGAIGAAAALALTCSPLLGALLVLGEVWWVRRLAQRPGHREFAARLTKSAIITGLIVLVLPFVVLLAYVQPLD